MCQLYDSKSGSDRHRLLRSDRQAKLGMCKWRASDAGYGTVPANPGYRADPGYGTMEDPRCRPCEP